jgi:hypothetical protein
MSTPLLVSLHDLAAIWQDKSYSGLIKMVQRSTLSRVQWLTKEKAEERGLAWGRGRGRNGKRPFIDINDPAVPGHVRGEYLKREADHEQKDSGTSPADEVGAPNGAAAQEHSAASSWRAPGFEQLPPERTSFSPSPGLSDPQGTPALPVPGREGGSGGGGEEPGPSPLPATAALSDEEVDAQLYAAAPEYARRKCDKYLRILQETEGMKGETLKWRIEKWNRENPELKTSYPSVIEARRTLTESGRAGLLARYGKRAGRTTVKDSWFETFRMSYLTEGAPSLRSCWMRTLGKARQDDPALTAAGFPSANAFLRRLKRELPEQAIFRARHGAAAWNRKHHRYIDRDYSNLKPGECYVSDHAQVDVAVMPPRGSPCFPWVTAWRDFKSGKWLGWLLHPEAPNSDHVFQSFYSAVKSHGLPTDVYIDNGKDYRCRDFAGGRKAHRVAVEEGRAAAMLGLLGIAHHFSLPYNAQAKTIERDFLKNKNFFSKHMPGYRGGHVKERPEKLKDEIRAGDILPWKEFKALFDSFITDVLNRMPSEGKALRGASPDELWQRERTEERRVSPDALKLFCMRTSKALTIGRNGVRDSASTPVEKAQLKRLMARKRQEEKVVKSYLEMQDRPSPQETLAHLSAGVEAVNEDRGAPPGDKRPKVLKLADTPMDEAVREAERMEKEGTFDLSAFLPPEKEEKEPIFLWETDREEWKRKKKNRGGR